MKKILTAVLAAYLMFVALTAFAEGASSDVECLDIRDGILTRTEVTDFVSVTTDEYKPLRFQTEKVIDLSNGVYWRFARLQYKISRKHDYICRLDAGELKSAIETLRYVKKHGNALHNYAEISYSSNNTKVIPVPPGYEAGELTPEELIDLIGFSAVYDSNPFKTGIIYEGGKKYRMMVYLELTPFKTAYVPLKQIDKLIAAFETLLSQIDE